MLGTRRVLAVGVVLLGLVGAACGGGGGGGNAGGVKTSTWTRDVCTAVSSWQSELQKGAQDVQAAVQPGAAPVEGRRVLVDYLQRAVQVTDRMLAQLKDAGAPDVKRGGEIATDLRNGLAQARAALQDAQRTAETLPIDDRVKFGTAATELGTSISKAFDSIGKTFDGLNKKYNGPPELDRAFNSESACKSL
jgi:hypothetical protein